MTETEKKNLVHQAREAMARMVKKHMRENVVHPSDSEYVECLEMAVKEMAVIVRLPKRGPGRPRKVKVEDLGLSTPS